jgi:hypothetical protein
MTAFRVDDTQRLIDVLSLLRAGDPVCIDIPVLVGSQGTEEIARSIFTALFISEGLTKGLEAAALEMVSEADEPNHEIARLCGRIQRRETLLSFLDEWSACIDANGANEPIDLFEEGEELLNRLESAAKVETFQWPLLAAWYREVRSLSQNSE